MIKKKKINFGTLAAFLQKKVSTSSRNTEYTMGPDDGIKMKYIGEPDIMWQTICFIKDVQQIWTGGQLYNCTEIDLSVYYTKEELDKLLASSLLKDVKTDHSTGKYIVAEDNDALGFARAADVAVQILNNEEVVAASLNDLNERDIDLNNRFDIAVDTLNTTIFDLSTYLEETYPTNSSVDDNYAKKSDLKDVEFVLAKAIIEMKDEYALKQDLKDVEYLTAKAIGETKDMFVPKEDLSDLKTILAKAITETRNLFFEEIESLKSQIEELKNK